MTVTGDLLHWAWSIICNAGGGNWETQTPEWQAAAASFRDDYHAHLRGEQDDAPVAAEQESLDVG